MTARKIEESLDEFMQLKIAQRGEVTSILSVRPEVTRALAELATRVGKPETPKRVFLSHSSKDKPYVRSLKKRLEARGIESWLDEAELRTGDSLGSKISEAIQNSDAVVAVLSEASVGSRWVNEELRQAMARQIERSRTLVLPVLKEKCALPAFLADKLYEDFSTRARQQKNFERLVRSILEG